MIKDKKAFINAYEKLSTEEIEVLNILNKIYKDSRKDFSDDEIIKYANYISENRDKSYRDLLVYIMRDQGQKRGTEQF